MEGDSALRPSMPTEPTAQLRWLIARQTEALIQVAAAELRQVVTVLIARESP